jgi:hypothetical protein
MRQRSGGVKQRLVHCCAPASGKPHSRHQHAIPAWPGFSEPGARTGYQNKVA